MTWTCGAIDHGVVFHSNGTIAPCCLIDYSYRKPVELLTQDPFQDLRTGTPAAVCHRCVEDEANNLPSYRQSFTPNSGAGIQFLDIRNTNLCNIKCRSCDPDNSNQIAQERQLVKTLIKQDIMPFKDYLFTSDLQRMYYTGGEPLINHEHWEILQMLVDKGLSHNIQLQYNSNLTVLKYKTLDIFDLWKNFKSVTFAASIDAVGDKAEIIRSGTNWNTVKENLQRLKTFSQSYRAFALEIHCTVSLMNIWYVAELLEYFKEEKVRLFPLTYPDYLCLSALPEDLKELAEQCLTDIENLGYNKNSCQLIRNKLEQDQTQLFPVTLLQITYLDKLRNENLLDILPGNFKKHIWKTIS